MKQYAMHLSLRGSNLVITFGRLQGRFGDHGFGEPFLLSSSVTAIANVGPILDCARESGWSRSPVRRLELVQPPGRPATLVQSCAFTTIADAVARGGPPPESLDN